MCHMTQAMFYCFVSSELSPRAFWHGIQQGSKQPQAVQEAGKKILGPHLEPVIQKAIKGHVAKM